MTEKLTRNPQAPWQVRYFFLSEWPPALLLLLLVLISFGTIFWGTEHLNSLFVLCAGLACLSGSFALLYVLLNWWIPYRYLHRHGENRTGFVLEYSRGGNIYAVWQKVYYLYQDAQGLFYQGHFKLSPWHKIEQTQQHVTAIELEVLTKAASQCYGIPQGTVPLDGGTIYTFQLKMLPNYAEVSMPVVTVHLFHALSGLLIHTTAMLVPLGPGLFLTMAALHDDWVWPGEWNRTINDPCAEISGDWFDAAVDHGYDGCPGTAINPHMLCHEDFEKRFYPDPEPETCPEPIPAWPQELDMACMARYDEWLVGYKQAVSEQCGWWYAHTGINWGGAVCSVQYHAAPTLADCESLVVDP